MMRFRTLLVPAVALLAVGAFAQAPQTSALPNLVTAVGNADVQMAPDLATIRIGVDTQGKTAKEAQASTNLLANRIIAAAMKVVPDKKAYQTSDLSLFPDYSQGPNGAPNKIIGYRARNVVTICLEDVSKVGPMVDAVTDAGATNIDSISFGLKDDKVARRQALIVAVKEAREKAEAMAEGLGLRLGSVYSVEEGGGPGVRPYEAAMASFARNSPTPVMPGQVSVGASVVVRFVLSPAKLPTGGR